MEWHLQAKRISESTMDWEPWINTKNCTSNESNAVVWRVLDSNPAPVNPLNPLDFWVLCPHPRWWLIYLQVKGGSKSHRAYIWSEEVGNQHKLKANFKSLGRLWSLKGMRPQSYRLTSNFFFHEAVSTLKLKTYPLFKGRLHLIGAKPNQVQVWHSYDSLSRVDYTDQLLL